MTGDHGGSSNSGEMGDPPIALGGFGGSTGSLTGSSAMKSNALKVGIGMVDMSEVLLLHMHNLGVRKVHVVWVSYPIELR